MSYKPIGITSSVRIRKGTTQSINPSSATYLTFDTEDWDHFGGANLGVASDRITFPSNGIADIVAYVRFASNSTGVRYAGVEIFDSSDVAKWTSASLANGIAAVNGFDTEMTLSFAYKVSAGDYIKIWAYQTSGGALNVADKTNMVVNFIRDGR